MRRKPDMIRTVVLLFVIGLAATGLTSFGVSEDEPRVIPAEISAQGQWLSGQRSEG
ncbi:MULTISPECIES: hypothetical protein [Marinobacter]|uniref:Uncharacterized protein n=1 Tax=Marinobacter segnicrescens TaxID=430453 RepID=A0A1H9ZUT9_9GAMM|nr:MULTISPECIES: hypothetical protein [Marinobacter]UZD66418.1 hypothetical protein LJ360_03410 [Marinobacter sp. AN1]SES85532.1 hypothetical protein SAMN04487962_10264 [Marinobacter segnicrescens]